MLTKPTTQTFVPGTPEIPFRAAYTVCVPPSAPGDGPTGPGGHWETRCESMDVLIGVDNGPATFDNPGPFPQPIYAHLTSCRSVWVP